jgi:membrane-bound serine protease (ClpP class)
MSWFLAILLICTLLGLLILLIVATSRHKKSATSQIQLIGSSGLVDTELNPQGSVLIRGELWSARSLDGTRIAPHTRVRVVELQGHLVAVERIR